MLCAPPNNVQSPSDALYLERFELLLEKILAEIRGFSEREGRLLEQTRNDVARWHYNHIFECQSVSGNSNRPTEIWNILASVSHILESLHDVFGVESFVLAIDPEESSQGGEATSAGFLGGSIQGREFWRGLRTGGESGARAFKEQCIKNKKPDAIISVDPTINASPSISAKQSSKNVKLDLYDSMRKALRSVSGIRNAEMKWTNHERLFTYGVYLVGWPSDIPVKNPSSLKAGQNKRLLELMNDGTLKFVKNVLLASGGGSSSEPLNSVNVNEDVPAEEENETEESDEMFSWAIQYEPPTNTDTTSGASAAQTPDTAAEASRLSESSRPRKRAKYGQFRGDRIRFQAADDVIK